ncbi:hypothetical protein BH20ACT2_BH20ACT2_09570 [soil metagenome]
MPDPRRPHGDRPDPDQPPDDLRPDDLPPDDLIEVIGRLVDHAPPPPAFAGILRAAERAGSPAMTKPTTTRWLAAAAVAVLIAGIGGFLALRDGDGDVDVVADDGSSTTTDTSTPDVTTTASIPAPAPGEPKIDGQFETLAGTDEALLAVGRAAGGTYLWRSTDVGRTWTPVPQPVVFDGADLLDLAGTDEGFVAVAASPEGAPIVAASPDGAQWDLLTNAPETFGGDVPLAIAQDAEGFVVAAQTFGEAGEPIGGSVWSSPDGMMWTGGPNELFAELNEGTITDAFATPEDGLFFAGFDLAGGFLLTGGASTGLGGPGGTPADGVSVQRPEPFATSTVQGVTAVDESVTVSNGTETRTAPGLIAVGERQPAGNGALSWRSDDGLTWEVLDNSAFGPETGLVGVASVDGVTVAIGRDGETSAAWRLEGDTWTRI